MLEVMVMELFNKFDGETRTGLRLESLFLAYSCKFLYCQVLVIKVAKSFNFKFAKQESKPVNIICPSIVVGGVGVDELIFTNLRARALS
jgi:hypothetical protein